MKCPYVTPSMECYFKAQECIGPCPVLVVTNRKRCSLKSPATSTEDRNPENPNTSAGRTANEGEGVGGDTS